MGVAGKNTRAGGEGLKFRYVKAYKLWRPAR